ncbi:unnamed protein product [Cylicocyclus nassatus]|uniref:Activin types I and II receptor domain-containing protein n=1 Tax=Cylicocyclus nassatus TaxID=53992 RepID=A0AA36H002_CYLNA|nr:unnamed protein product [Cylicocyclus nassatus]
MHINQETEEKLSIRGCAPPFHCTESTCSESTNPDSAYTVNYCCCDSDLCNYALQANVLFITIVFAALLGL